MRTQITRAAAVAALAVTALFVAPSGSLIGSLTGDPAEASHQPADVVCEYFKPHTGDTTVWAIWDGGQTRYECAYHHPGSILIWNHTLCAYPPEHYSPPDNVWVKQNNCP